MTNQEYIISRGKAGERWYEKHTCTEWFRLSPSDVQVCCGVHLDFPLLNGSRVFVQDVPEWLKDDYGGKWVV